MIYKQAHLITLNILQRREKSNAKTGPENWCLFSFEPKVLLLYAFCFFSNMETVETRKGVRLIFCELFHRADHQRV